jgi:hypothetical protein
MKKRLKTFAPGRYRTVINIHNPTERKIEIAASSHLASSLERLRVHSASLRTTRSAPRQARPQANVSRWDAQNTFATISPNTGHIRPVIRSTVGDGE